MSSRIYDLPNIKDIASQSLRASQLLRASPKLELLTAANVGPALETMLTCMDWLDERIRLVVERDGTVLAAGGNALTGLGQSDCLVLVDRRLRAITRDSQSKLDALLGVGGNRISTAVLDRRNGDGHCILRAAGLCDQAIVLTVQLAHPGFVPKLANLGAAFGLTPSEAHVVERLHQGHGPQDICDELGISVHTVRAHLRHCYDKLGVSSREELSRKLAPYRLN